MTSASPLTRIWSPSHQLYVPLGGRTRPKQRSIVQIGDFLKGKQADAPTVSLPAGPPTLDLTAAALSSLRNVYLNQKFGCCVPAGTMHVRGVTSGNASGGASCVTCTDAELEALYRQMNGNFDPNDPSTDTGCDEQTAFRTLMSQGWPDGVKLVGFAGINGADPVLVRKVLYAFENVVYGMELAQEWISPFPSADGYIWGAAKGEKPVPANGHCVPGVGYTKTGVTIDSWALFGEVTDEANAEFTSEAGGGELYVLFAPDTLAKAAAKSPDHFAYDDLAAALASLQAA